MKETLKSFQNRCRCCLESFSEDENISPITEFFAIQFYAFTRLELETDDVLSNHVCEFCHSELLRFSVFKKDLIEKQLKLYHLLKQYKQELLDSDQEEIFEELPSDIVNKNIDNEYDEIDQIGSISENYSETSDDPTDDESASISESDVEDSSFNPSPVIVKKLICDFCNSHFQSKKGISRHLKSHVTNEPGDWKCDLCSFSTTTKYRMVAHKQQFHPDSIVTMDNYFGEEIEKPKKDQNADEKVDEKGKETKTKLSRVLRYRCFCGRTFVKKAAVITHCKEKHGVLKRCNYGCNRNFENVGLWIRHIQKLHPEFEEECLKMVTASKSNVWYTEIRESDKNIQDLLCRNCTYYGLTKAELIKHYQLKHSPTDGRGECPMCFKVFSTHSSLRVHINNMHNKVKGFKCSVCKMKYKDISQLRIHTRNVHQSTYRPYSCSECKEKFSLMSSLKKHQLDVHDDQSKADLKLEELHQKMHVCVCKKYFEYPSRLKTHQQKCKVIEELANDYKIPSRFNGKDVYRCKTCRKTYVHKANLMKHLKNLKHTMA